MLLKSLFCFIFVVTTVVTVNVKLRKRSTLYLPFEYQFGIPQFEFKKDSAEKLAYDPANKVLYTVGGKVLHAIDVSDPDNMAILSHLEYHSMEFADVEYCGGYVFTTSRNVTDKGDGKAMVFTALSKTRHQMQEIHKIPVGASPDMLKTTSDCSKLIVAVEGQIYRSPVLGITDPPGLVAIITFPNGVNKDYSFIFLDFQHFDSKYEQLRASGVRKVYNEGDNPLSNDVEPESITINPDNTIAYVVLQENNAVAKVDLVSQNITAIYGLGYKDWSISRLDPSDRDGATKLSNHKVLGMYQPDTVAHFQFKGDNYLAMANEGAARRYNFGMIRWHEESRGSHLLWGEVVNLDAELRGKLQNNTILGRLLFSTSAAEKEPDGSFKKLYTYGGRSWSIRRADDLSLVYDSDEKLAKYTLEHNPDLFNCKAGKADKEPHETSDSRSDNRGTEPEDIAVGVVGGATLFFIANEKPGTIMVFTVENDLTKPRFQDFYTGIPQTRGKSWQQLYQEGVLSEVECEDMQFLSANESPTRRPVLLAAGSKSGTVSIIDVIVT